MALPLSGTLAGPAIASDWRLRVEPLSHVDGAPETARSVDAVPWTARTVHGTADSSSRLTFQRPPRGVTVPSAAPVAALLSVTGALVGAMPLTESLPPSHEARVIARLAAVSATAVIIKASASALHVRIFIR